MKNKSLIRVVSALLLVAMLTGIMPVGMIEKSFAAEPASEDLFDITNEGEIKARQNVKLPEKLVIPSVIRGITVTRIGSSAFKDNQLTSVTIPDSVTSIGSYAFENSQLTSVTIPDSVTSIEWYAFENNQLTSVTIPDSVTSIGSYAFENNRLTSVTIPDSVTSIGSSAFRNNQLTSVTIPDSVAIIGEKAFYNNQLTSVTIPDSVTSIGSYAFENNAIDNVHFGKLVKEIKQRAFYNNRLTSIKLPLGIQQLESDVFGRNPLVEIEIPGNVLTATSSFPNNFDEDYKEANKAPGLYKYNWAEGKWKREGDYGSATSSNSSAPNITVVNGKKISGTIRDTQIEGTYNGITFTVEGNNTKYTGTPKDVPTTWTKVETLKKGKIWVRSISAPTTEQQVINFY